MTISECLKGGANNSTLNAGQRWIYWDDFNKHWVVRERLGRARCRTVLETEDEEKAVAALLA